MKDRKKVLMITPGLLPVPITQGGAIEALVQQLADENEEDSRLDLEVVSLHEPQAEVESLGYQNTRFFFIRRNPACKKILRPIAGFAKRNFGFYMDSNIDYTWKVQELLKKNHYDIIVIENAPSLVLPVSKVSRAPIFLHLHNNHLNRERLNSAEIFSACHRVLTVSEYIKNCVLTVPGADPQKIRVLRNCIDTGRFDPSRYQMDRTRLRQKYGIAPEETVLLFSGRLTKDKGVRQLLEAFVKLGTSSARLLLVGGVWYGNNKENRYLRDLRRMAQIVKGKVIFTGFVPYAELPCFHAMSDVAIVPSVWEEPGALVVIEAMSSGLPLIITDSGGMCEYVDADCAWIVKRNEQLVDSLSGRIGELIAARDKRKAMGAAGRQRAVRCYDKKRYFESFLESLDG